MPEREDRHGVYSSPESDSQPQQFWSSKSRVQVKGTVGVYIIHPEYSYLDETINGALFLFKRAVGIQYLPRDVTEENYTNLSNGSTIYQRYHVQLAVSLAFLNTLPLRVLIRLR